MVVVTPYTPVGIDLNFANDIPLTTAWELTYAPDLDYQAQLFTLQHSEKLLSQLAQLYLDASTADIVKI